MDSAFDTDMDAAAHWPVAVDVSVRIDYPNGSPEYSRLRLQALPPPDAVTAVHVSRRQPGGEAVAPQAVGWAGLPGHTLFPRCLHVLAVHLFGSVDMPPRIVGLPLWCAVTMDLTIGADDPQALHVELRTTTAGRATLRWQLRRDQPLRTATAVLDALDADPLRAMLRLGLAHVRPIGVAAPPPSRRGGSAPPPRLPPAAASPAGVDGGGLQHGTSAPLADTLASALPDPVFLRR